MNIKMRTFLAAGALVFAVSCVGCQPKKPKDGEPEDARAPKAPTVMKLSAVEKSETSMPALAEPKADDHLAAPAPAPIVEPLEVSEDDVDLPELEPVVPGTDNRDDFDLLDEE